jgi:uncharacterized OB-fold protein
MDKPVPSRAMGLNAEFYDFCRQDDLRFQRCDDCGTWRHPPRVLCASCGSGAWTWTPSSRRGEVYTWTVTHQAMHPAFADDTPYAIVVAEMEEGVRLVAGLLELAPADLRIGLPVEVVFVDRAEGFRLPMFLPR